MSAVRIEITDQMKPNLCGGPEQSFQKHFPAGLQGHLDQNTWAMFTNDIEGELQPHTSRLRTWTRLSCGIVSIGMVIFFIGFLIQFVGINRSFYGDEDETGGISIPRTFSLVIGTSVAGFITMFVGATVRVLIVSRMNGQILSALQRICSRYTELSGLTFAAVQEVHGHGKHAYRHMYLEIQTGAAVVHVMAPSIVGHMVQGTIQGSSCTHCGVPSSGNFCSNCGKNLMEL
jgi:uncharacterized membrane protein